MSTKLPGGPQAQHQVQRNERLSHALRENLKRRKEQSRARGAAEADDTVKDGRPSGTAKEKP